MSEYMYAVVATNPLVRHSSGWSRNGSGPAWAALATNPVGLGTSGLGESITVSFHGSSISVGCQLLQESFVIPGLNRTASYKAQFELDGQPAPATMISVPANDNLPADGIVLTPCWKSDALSNGHHILHIKNLLSCDATPLIIDSFTIGSPAERRKFGYLMSLTETEAAQISAGSNLFDGLPTVISGSGGHAMTEAAAPTTRIGSFPDPTGGSSAGLDTGAKVGIAFGALGGVSILVGAFVLLRLFKRRKARNEAKSYVVDKPAFDDAASTYDNDQKAMDFVGKPAVNHSVRRGRGPII